MKLRWMTICRRLLAVAAIVLAISAGVMILTLPAGQSQISQLLLALIALAIALLCLGGSYMIRQFERRGNAERRGRSDEDSGTTI